jgi:hypothetical protein
MNLLVEDGVVNPTHDISAVGTGVKELLEKFY